MSAFFPINPSGGAGGGQPQQGNAFVNATINGNDLVLVRGDGSSVRVDLSKIIPDITDDLIKNITLNGNNLTLEYASGTTHNVDLKPILKANNVDYDNVASGLQAVTVQEAIDEINSKLDDAYTSSSYTEATGIFELTKVDGSKDEYRLAGLDAENEFTKVNVMPDLMINSITKTNEHYSNTHGITSGRWFGIKSQTTEDFYNGFAEHIRVYVENIQQGTTELSGFKVWSVDSETDQYIEEIKVVQPVKIQGTGQAQYVDIPIKREFDKNVYFVFYLPPAVGGQFNRFRSLTNVAQYQADFVNTDIQPQANQTPPQSTQGWCIYAELHGRISVKDKLMSSYTISDYDTQTGELTLTRHDGTNDTHTLSVGGGTVTNVEYRSVDNKLIVTKDAQTPPVEYDLSNLLGVREFAYDDNTQKITVLDHNNAPVEVDLNVFARLDRDNLFLGHNTFNELILLGKTPFVSTGGSKQTSAHKVDRYCGDRRVSTHSDGSPNPKYISAIKIEILPSVDVGETVSGVYVAEITKGGSRLDDIIGDVIVNNGSYLVEQDELGAKVIYVPIRKEYQVDTYFLIGKQGDRNLRESWDAYSPKEEFVNDFPITNFPQAGTQLNWTMGNGWIVTHGLFTDDINVREELKRLDDYVPKSDLTTVGGQGNADKVPQLGNDGKIDISMIPNLSLNNTHVVRDEQEALQLIDGGTVNIGDVFILTDNQNSVHMYVDQAGLGFDDKCVELTMSNGAIVSVNKTYADATGNINLSLEVNGDNLEFKVNNVDIKTLSLYTDTEANDLIATFV